MINEDGDVLKFKRPQSGFYTKAGTRTDNFAEPVRKQFESVPICPKGCSWEEDNKRGIFTGQAFAIYVGAN